MAKVLLPDVLSDLLRCAPGVTIELKTSISGELLSLLKNGFLDLAFTHVAGPIDDCEVVPLVDDDVIVVAGRTHPIFRSPYTIHDLARYNWIMPKDSAARTRINAVLAECNCPPPRTQIEASSILYLPRLIAGTDLLSLLSRRNLTMLDDGGLLREVALSETRMHRVFCLVYEKQSYLSPATRRLVELFRNKAKTLVS